MIGKEGIYIFCVSFFLTLLSLTPHCAETEFITLSGSGATTVAQGFIYGILSCFGANTVAKGLIYVGLLSKDNCSLYMPAYFLKAGFQFEIYKGVLGLGDQVSKFEGKGEKDTCFFFDFDLDFDLLFFNLARGNGTLENISRGFPEEGLKGGYSYNELEQYQQSSVFFFDFFFYFNFFFSFSFSLYSGVMKTAPVRRSLVEKHVDLNGGYLFYLIGVIDLDFDFDFDFYFDLDLTFELRSSIVLLANPVSLAFFLGFYLPNLSKCSMVCLIYTTSSNATCIFRFISLLQLPTQLTAHYIMQKAKSRLQEFRNNIRRQHFQQIRKEHIMHSELDFTSLPQIAEMMLCPSEYTLNEIIDRCAQQLSKPPLFMDIQPIPIQSHIKFWKFYSQQLHIDESVWNPTLKQILIQIIKNCNYRDLHQNTNYQLHFLNTLQNGVKNFTSQERDKVMEWIVGPQGIRVLQSCIDIDGFLMPKSYPIVYRVLQLGLKSQLRSQSQQAARVVTKLMASADFDESWDVYQQAHGLVTYICIKIQRYCAKEVTNVYNKALLYLTAGYDDMMIDYARTGVAYTACLLVVSKIQQNQLQGLNILRLLSEVNNSKMCQLLLQNSDITSSGVWNLLVCEKQLSQHENTQIRKNYYSFFTNMMANGTRQQCQEICLRFSKSFDSFFHWLELCLYAEKDQFLLILLCKCLQSLMFYADNSIVPVLQQHGIVRRLEELSLADSDQLTQTCAFLLKKLQEDDRQL